MKLFAYALRDYDELPYLEAISQELGFSFDWTSEYPCLENAHLAEGYDALCIITNPMTPELLDRFHELGVKYLATRSIGYDHIDLVHAAKLGMRVGHAAYPPEGVADYTVMLLLMAIRKAKLIFRGADAQDFTLRGKIGLNLPEQTVGVVGTGKIGAAVIERLHGFDCKILASDPYPSEHVRTYATYVDLDTLLAESNIVTLHAPGLPENHHMINAERIARMKNGVVIVNAARGLLIDTEALIDGIESGKIGGAALDTVENEEGLYYLDRSRSILHDRHRAVLQAFPNVTLSPHMAFYTETDVENMVRTSAEALLAFSRGEETPHEVGVARTFD